jgi:hypothetical protein
MSEAFPKLTLRCYPCRVVSISYQILSPFHGGNTGSNPVGDANISPPRCRLLCGRRDVPGRKPAQPHVRLASIVGQELRSMCAALGGNRGKP